jgi:hypothetical protein
LLLLRGGCHGALISYHRANGELAVARAHNPKEELVQEGFQGHETGTDDGEVDFRCAPAGDNGEIVGECADQEILENMMTRIMDMKQALFSMVRKLILTR